MNEGKFPRASEAFKKANPHIFGDTGNDLALGRGPTEKPKNTGIRRGATRMNKTEYEFSLYLEAMKSRGDITRYEFQGMSLRWGRDEKTGESMRYTPDFVVSIGGAVKRMIEIKGRQVIYQQQALARFKGCRSDWPEFEFQMWKKTETGWTQVL